MLYSSAIYTVSNIINVAIPLALIPFLVRHLPPDDYGKLAVIQTLTTALSSFVGLNVASAANNKYFGGEKSREEIPRYLGYCVQIIIATGLVAVCVLLISYKYLTQLLGLNLGSLLLVIMLTTCTALINLILSQWEIRKMSIVYAGVQTSQAVLNALLTLLFVGTMSFGYQGRLGAQACGVGFVAIISLIVQTRRGNISLTHLDLGYFADALKFGIPLIPHCLGNAIIAGSDRMMIASTLGYKQLGIYMIAVQIAMGLQLLFESINKSYAPWLFDRLSKNEDIINRLIVRKTYWAFIAIGCCVILFNCASPFAVEWIAKDEYTSARKYLTLLSVGQGFGGMYFCVTNYLFYARKTGLLSWATILPGVLSILGTYLLMPRFGLHGVAYVFMLCMALRFLVTWVLANRVFPMPWFSFITTKATSVSGV
jgi:O-antigen/teichoic acid export membrane protein